jgi:phosphoenolpyruvate carboxykinase (ATP)
MAGVDIPRKYGLDHHGIENVNQVYWNLSTAGLYEEALKRHEGRLAHLGPLVVRTGDHTGRSPNDKFIVREPSCEDKVCWGPVNRPIEEAHFEGLRKRMLVYLQDKDIFIQDCYAGADPAYRLPVRIITERAWHNLFARNMFIQIHDTEELANYKPEFTIIDCPRFHAVPESDGTNSDTFIIVHFGTKLVLIGGTAYAGEIKKSVFTYLNYTLPQMKVFPMHCSANVGRERGDVAVFFGLSGTGKTSLSADPRRDLIGDDEHGWSDNGIFNFEGGCYAKVIRLSPEDEPEIYACTEQFGTLLENVTMNSITRRPDLDDDSLTENTRASYHITEIERAVIPGIGSHPENVIMLTCDAFGVLPPISRLTHEQAMYHFLSGYTAKVAGTERGMGDEPQATFSTCFGAPFMALHPTVYANMLGEKIAKHKATCWLINTGWTGGPYGVGSRIQIGYTRAMVDEALSGRLADAPTTEDPIFGLHVPTSVNGVPSELLSPRSSWSSPKGYDEKARELAGRFRENFSPYEPDVSEAVRAAGPKEG